MDVRTTQRCTSLDEEIDYLFMILSSSLPTYLIVQYHNNKIDL